MRKSLIRGNPSIPIPGVNVVDTKFIADNSLAVYFTANANVGALPLRITQGAGAACTITESGSAITYPLEENEQVDLYIQRSQVVGGDVSIVVLDV